MTYIPDSKYEKIAKLKNQGKYKEAIKLANSILARDPGNERALIQVADINYVKGDMSAAEKPVDFLMKYKGKSDSMTYYIKGIIEMEKTNWPKAKEYLQKAMKKMDQNPEVIRCYALTEYWMGNKEEGFRLLEDCFKMQPYDAEILYNIIELSIIEKRYEKAEEKIDFYESHIDKIKYHDKDKEYYDAKLDLLKKYLESKNK